MTTAWGKKFQKESMGKNFSERKFGEKNGTLDGKVHHIHMDYDPRKENTHWKICQE